MFKSIGSLDFVVKHNQSIVLMGWLDTGEGTDEKIYLKCSDEINLMPEKSIWYFREDVNKSIKKLDDVKRGFVFTFGEHVLQNKKVELIPYVITGHPGSTEEDAKRLVNHMQKLGLTVRKFQDFTPTPGTLATAMQVSGNDTNGRNIIIPSASQKNRQRAIIESAFYRSRQIGKRRYMKRRKRN